LSIIDFFSATPKGAHMTIQVLNTFNRILETNHGFETNFLKVLYYDFPQYYKDRYHSYEYSRFCTILNGQKKVSYDGGSPFIYDKGQFLLLPPNSTVTMEISVPTRAFVLEINDCLIQEVSEKVSNDLEMDVPARIESNCFDFSLAPYVDTAFQHVVEACFSTNRDKAFWMDLYAQELAYHLICVQSTRGLLTTKLSNPIFNTIRFMNANWDEKESLSELAGMANMSINSYIQQFKKLTGMTPVEYRTGIRMSHARNLLRTHTVSETAFELGYENISHFIRIFRDKYGVTPKQYQKHFDDMLSNANISME
jgi:AraC-like DNA-binding protein